MTTQGIGALFISPVFPFLTLEDNPVTHNIGIWSYVRCKAVVVADRGGADIARLLFNTTLIITGARGFRMKTQATPPVAGLFASLWEDIDINP